MPAKKEAEVIFLCKHGCCPSVRRVVGGVVFEDREEDKVFFLTTRQFSELKKLIREDRI